MEDILACRVCLATGVNLYDMYKFKLKHIFENISGIQMSPADNYPQYLCSYCTSLLQKSFSFRERCRKAQDIMKCAEMQNQLTTIQLRIIAAAHQTTLPLTSVSPVIISYPEQPSELNTEDLKKEPIDNLIKEEESDEEPLSNKIKKKSLVNQQEEVVDGQEILTDKVSVDAFDASFDFEEPNEIEKEKELLEDDIEVIFLTKQQQINDVIKRKNSINYINSFYKCEHCFKGFIQDNTFKNHMMRHDPAYGKHTCEICGTRWPSYRALKSHCSSAHERKYICKICDYVCKSSFRAREHLKWHKGHTFICKICGASFAKSTSYLTHLRMQHPSKFSCDVCGESFLGKVGLNMHKKKSHNMENLVQKATCDCGLQFKSLEALKKHTSKLENGVCDTSVSACFQCGEDFTTPELLKQHLKTHETTVRCEECNRNFAHQRSFSVHYQRVHLGLRMKHYNRSNIKKKPTCVCEMCGKKCMSKASLIYHQRTHTGEKPFHCTECPKRFSMYQRLQIHVRTHTGERPFKCSHCPKAFKHKAALNRHDRVHTGLKPYQCSHCGKSFSQSNSMKVHVRTVHLKLPAPYRSRRKNNE